MRLKVQCYQLGGAYRTVVAKTHPIGLMAQRPRGGHLGSARPQADTL